MQLFENICSQYDKLKKRNAFMDQYKKFSSFEDDLGEFDDSRETVQSLIDECKAAE